MLVLLNYVYDHACSVGTLSSSGLEMIWFTLLVVMRIVTKLNDMQSCIWSAVLKLLKTCSGSQAVVQIGCVLFLYCNVL